MKGMLRKVAVTFSMYFAMGANLAFSEVLFNETFDDLEDWTSTMYTDKTYQAVWFGDTLPDGWDTIYQSGFYHPPSAHDSLEILAINSDKAKGNEGKSAVHWREHHINPDFERQWKSNSALGIHLEEGYDQLYVEFWIAFDPNWTSSTGSSKVLRIFSWDEEGDFWQGFEGGAQGPILFWDYSYDDQYGLRNFLAFRGGPHGENYKMTSDEVGDLPRGLSGLGDMSGNYTTNMIDSTYSPGPKLTNRLTGSPLPNIGSVSHEMVFGSPGTWTKVALFVKMNSAPGVQDGQVKQWIDNKLVLESNRVQWIGGSSPYTEIVKWNAVSIGGNDYWVDGGYSNSEQREEWYAIDDVLIATKKPGSASIAKPNPPSSISIQN